MMWIGSRRLPPVMICALVAIAGGFAGGSATVRGMRADHSRPANATALFGRAEAATPGEGPGEVVAGCPGCSERDLGYRWASLAAVRLPGQCPDDSWGFRRGCLDFVGGI